MSDLPRRWLIAAAILVALELPLVWPIPLHLGDTFYFWYAGHLVASGASPYDPTAWTDAARAGEVVDGIAMNTLAGDAIARMRWLYPPWLALALAPFGALPLALGLATLHVTLILGAFAAFAWVSARFAGDRSAAGLALVAGVVSLPFVEALRVGHPEPLLLIGAVLVLGALDRTSAPALSAGALVLATKPHLAIVLALAVAVVLARRGAWSALAIATGAVAAATAVGFAMLPADPTVLVPAALAKTDQSVATTYALVHDLGLPSASGIALASAAAVLAFFALRWAMPGRRTAILVGAGLALSLIVSPYVHTYDHVLLFPAGATALACAAGAGASRALLRATVFGSIAIAPVMLFLTDYAVADQGPSGAVPLLALGVLAIAARAERGARAG